MARRLFGRSSRPESQFVAWLLRNETTGGMLMLLAAVVALVWINISESSYTALSDTVIGPTAFHLDLSLATWATDGLLAVFFLVAGLELKRELAVGKLRRPAEAVLPIVAAVCGMVVPVVIYVIVNLGDGGDLRGWAVPTATDIAFALAVLAVIGSKLPTTLRSFLLTLAVVDDLLAILIIAVFFTSNLKIWPLVGAAAILGLYFFLQTRNVQTWWIHAPLAAICWILMHESGVHATVVGLAFGLLTRAKRHPGEAESPAERIEHRVSPFSALFCVPVFALFAAGVTVSSESLRDVFTQPVALGVVLGLVAGKTLGIFLGTYLTSRFTSARLSDHLAWSDVFGLSALAGIGFTVSLLISELAFNGDHATSDLAKTAVLVASVIATLLATIVLRYRNATYRAISIDEASNGSSDNGATRS